MIQNDTVVSSPLNWSTNDSIECMSLAWNLQMFYSTLLEKHCLDWVYREYSKGESFFLFARIILRYRHSTVEIMRRDAWNTISSTESNASATYSSKDQYLLHKLQLNYYKYYVMQARTKHLKAVHACNLSYWQMWPGCQYDSIIIHLHVCQFSQINLFHKCLLESYIYAFNVMRRIFPLDKS